MVKIVGIRFRGAGKIYSFDPADFEVEVGMKVIVETVKGIEIGTVVLGAREYGLEMKLVEVEYFFDNSKIMFYYTSDNRVDFRELVKELAGAFHARIELRQIGVRNETQYFGGIGVCGRELCCHSFLADFGSVTIKMAKDQELPLHLLKIYRHNE